jgi:hypothetical protein
MPAEMEAVEKEATKAATTTTTITIGTGTGTSNSSHHTHSMGGLTTEIRRGTEVKWTTTMEEQATPTAGMIEIMKVVPGRDSEETGVQKIRRLKMRT